MELTLVKFVVILLTGVAAGFVNVLAGGGSFLTLAALEFAGLPPSMANATNRLGVVSQNALGLLGFKSKGVSTLRTTIEYAVPAVLGSIIGAYVIIDLPAAIFHRILGVAMIIILITIVFDTKRWIKKREGATTRGRRIASYVLFFLVGIYGGAIQAGVGFFLIASLVMVAGQDLVATNCSKILIVGLFTIVALAIFIVRGQVYWLFGLVLVAGNGFGGWLAGRMAVEKGERFVKGALAVMLTFVALQYLGVIPKL